MTGLLELAETIEARADVLNARAEEAEKRKSPDVITLLFAATEIYKIADYVREQAVAATPSESSPT